jgi:hypothetical protein
VTNTPRSRLDDNDFIARHHEIITTILRHDLDNSRGQRIESHICGHDCARGEREIDAIDPLNRLVAQGADYFGLLTRIQPDRCPSHLLDAVTSGRAAVICLALDRLLIWRLRIALASDRAAASF